MADDRPKEHSSMTEGPAAEGQATSTSPPRWKRSAFVAVIGAYYVVYYILFARQVAEYFKDIFRHFEFVRRLF
jgi:hypothetical protein